ncbi:MAG TPA: hypothetical protein VNL94_09005, partial [Candidatus Binatia bacterium]|nr:hypothetical protein [Candidatus Binatia bacterium]
MRRVVAPLGEERLGVVVVVLGRAVVVVRVVVAVRTGVPGLVAVHKVAGGPVIVAWLRAVGELALAGVLVATRPNRHPEQ